MKIGYILDQIEQDLQDPVTRVIPKTRPRLMEMLGEEITNLIQQHNISSIAKYLNPAVQCTVGDAQYGLPDDFGENFLRDVDAYSYPGEEGSYACFLLDSSNNQSRLAYMTPGAFYTEHDPAEENSYPDDYTILVGEDGQRQLVLGPKPDAQYTVAGVYKPDSWHIQEEDSLLVAGNLPLLKSAVIRRLDPNHIAAQDYKMHLMAAILQAAQASPTRIIPSLARY